MRPPPPTPQLEEKQAVLDSSCSLCSLGTSKLSFSLLPSSTPGSWSQSPNRNASNPSCSVLSSSSSLSPASPSPGKRQQGSHQQGKGKRRQRQTQRSCLRQGWLGAPPHEAPRLFLHPSFIFFTNNWHIQHTFLLFPPTTTL